jgi:hypothetical protein
MRLTVATSDRRDCDFGHTQGARGDLVAGPARNRKTGVAIDRGA